MVLLQDRYEMVPRDRSRWWKVCTRSCEIGTNGTRCCEIGAKCCEIGTRCCDDWCEMVRDGTRCCKIGTRWCEVSTSARSLKAVGEGSRNLHRHTHHTQMEEGGSTHKMHPAQKNCAGLRPRAVPSFILWGRWRQEGAAGWRSRRAGGKTTAEKRHGGNNLQKKIRRE